MVHEKENNNQNKRKDDFNLFEELDSAYRKDILGEKEYPGENIATIKTTFEAVVVFVVVLLCLAICLVLNLAIMIFITQITGLD